MNCQTWILIVINLSQRKKIIKMGEQKYLTVDSPEKGYRKDICLFSRIVPLIRLFRKIHFSTSG